ncbi:MAG: 3-phosphoshikimate 1-carboxyvinyltransferase [Methanomassiliicoccales archaeon]
MKLYVKPSSPLSGNIKAPPSKSATHRAFIFSLTGSGVFKIRNPLMSDDTRSTLEAIRLMGAHVSGEGTQTIESELHQAENVIDAGNSGTTARLISSVCALLPGLGVVTGDASLLRRPMGPLLEAITQLGGRAEATFAAGRLPCIFGGPLKGERAAMRGDISSQFASSLAIACCRRETDTQIELEGRIQSIDYLLLTLQLIAYFGGKAVFEDSVLYCSGSGPFKARSITIPGDFSSAAFILSAAAVTGGGVRVAGLDNRFIQADSRITRILADFGCSIERGKGSVTATGGKLAGAEIDCSSSPDLFPITCVVAAAASGKSVIRGTENLRFKESDRIAATERMLKALGVKCEQHGHGLEIHGGVIRGGRVDSEGDHRIAMAACVAGLASERGCVVEKGECYTVSYPGFVDDIRSCGGRVSLV